MVQSKISKRIFNYAYYQYGTFFSRSVISVDYIANLMVYSSEYLCLVFWIPNYY